eukprot:42761_1
MGVTRHIKIITRASILAILLLFISVIGYSITLTKIVFIDKYHGRKSTRILMLAAGGSPWSTAMVGVLFFILVQRLNHLLQSRCLHIGSFVWPCISIPAMLTFSFISIASDMSNIRNFLNAVGAIYMMSSYLIYLVVGVVYLKQINKVMRRRVEEQLQQTERELQLKEHRTDTNVDTGVAVSIATDRKPEPIVSLQTVEDTIRCAILVMI